MNQGMTHMAKDNKVIRKGRNGGIFDSLKLQSDTEKLLEGQARLLSFLRAADSARWPITSVVVP